MQAFIELVMYLSDIRREQKGEPPIFNKLKDGTSVEEAYQNLGDVAVEIIDTHNKKLLQILSTNETPNDQSKLH